MAPGTAGGERSYERDLLHPDTTSMGYSGLNSAMTYDSDVTRPQRGAQQALDLTPFVGLGSAW